MDKGFVLAMFILAVPRSQNRVCNKNNFISLPLEDVASQNMLGNSIVGSCEIYLESYNRII